MNWYYGLSDIKYCQVTDKRKVVCIHHIRKVLISEYSPQYLYNLDSVSKRLQHPKTTIGYREPLRYINDNHHLLEFISTYHPYHLDLNRIQFSSRLEIK